MLEVRGSAGALEECNRVRQAARLAADQLCLEEPRHRGIRMRLASVQDVTGLAETACGDVLARLDPRIAVGNPVELGAELAPLARAPPLRGSR